MSVTRIKSHVACVNCGGSGVVYTTGYDGMRHPLACPGCQGTGSQKVKR